MSHIFNDKGDVGIFFGLCIMMFTGLFYGVISMNLYDNPENRDWYLSVSRMIKGMPKKIAFPIVWTILYLAIVIGMFLYYRGETFPNSDYMIDTITLIFITNVMCIKLWPFVFFQLRKTVVALIMIVAIIVFSTIMSILFAIHDCWGSFVPFVCLTLWCLYALYINAMWIHIENHCLLDVKQRTPNNV